MKVLSVAGYHRTGKTTLVVNIILELRKRGFKVQSIKDIHSEKFTMEKEGSNSWKHWQASEEVVIARGVTETYQIWHKHLSLCDMLAHLDADYVIVEGMKSAALPHIICAKNEEQLNELINPTVFAISGIYADEHTDFQKLPVLRSTDNIEQIVDIIERKVFDVLPLSKPECCSECGFTCNEMVGKILNEERTRDDCRTDRNKMIELKFDDKIVEVVPYVQRTFADIIKAYAKNLKGYKEGDSIEIKVK